MGIGKMSAEGAIRGSDVPDAAFEWAESIGVLRLESLPTPPPEPHKARKASVQEPIPESYIWVPDEQRWIRGITRQPVVLNATEQSLAAAWKVIDSLRTRVAELERQFNPPYG